MRKYIQREMLEIVKTMDELCEAIWKECDFRNYQQAIELMQNGQQAAIALGEHIERIEGEGTEAVSILEEFCEYVYHLSERVGTEACNQRKEAKVLRKFIIRIENSIRHIKTTYEMVFMPYNASMWDCMESVYKAAAQDEDCQAYVVPIPYVDIKEQGKVRIPRYEGDKLPANIPVTNYRDYNLEVHHPEAIFIHNPYDDYNLVTSVEPEYYSFNLKKYTDQLVYIPYYVTGGVVPELHRRLPVHRYMDKMITQSENDRKYYTDETLQNKLLPLGSPKYDKIIAYEREKPAMPESWHEMLDGKKVFFYNVSLSSLLNDTELAMKKMAYVFSCFEKRRDAALLWRPHPLMESSLLSMRPMFYEQYMTMKERFLTEGLGVLDETGDVNQSIALSDAYIGECTSSIVHLFGAVGKPLFFFNMELLGGLSDKEKSDPLMTNIVEHNGVYWTFMHRFNALCNIDMETGAVKVVTQIPGEPAERAGLVSSLFIWKDTIVLVPRALLSIVHYNIVKKEFEFIPIDNAEHEDIKFTGAVAYGSGYFLIPCHYSAILQYAPEKQEYIYHRSMMKEIMQYGKEYDDEKWAYIAGVLLKDNILYMSLCRTNKIAAFNLDTYDYQIISIGDERNTYSSMLNLSNGILMKAVEGYHCTYWNMKEGKTSEVRMPSGEEFGFYPLLDGRIAPFLDFYRLHGKLLLLPRTCNQIFELDQDTMTFSKSEIDISKHMKPVQSGVFDNRWGHIRNVLTLNNDIFYNDEYTHLRMVFSDDGCLMDYDAENKTYKEIQPHLEKEVVKKLYPIEKTFGQYMLDETYAYMETSRISLSDFIDAIMEDGLQSNKEKQLDVYRNVAANLDGTCGEKVYEAIKKEIEY